MKEYIGCKVDYHPSEGWMKLTQPVLLQSFEDEFDLGNGRNKCGTPAALHSVLVEGDVKLDEEQHTNYGKGVGKLIHLTKYSRPDIAKAVQELSKFGSKPTGAHYKAMIRCMQYCVDTKEKGLWIQPKAEWKGNKDLAFEITGKSDSDFAKDPVTRRSVSGWSTYLNGAPYVCKSKMQRFVMLTVKPMQD